MDQDRYLAVKARLKDELVEWPVTAGRVRAAAEAKNEPEAAAAASRLPDDGSWLTMDDLWADLDPHLKEISHNA